MPTWYKRVSGSVAASGINFHVKIGTSDIAFIPLVQTILVDENYEFSYLILMENKWQHIGAVSLVELLQFENNSLSQDF